LKSREIESNPIRKEKKKEKKEKKEKNDIKYV